MIYATITLGLVIMLYCVRVIMLVVEIHRTTEQEYGDQD